MIGADDTFAYRPCSLALKEPSNHRLDAHIARKRAIRASSPWGRGDSASIDITMIMGDGSLLLGPVDACVVKAMWAWAWAWALLILTDRLLEGPT